MLYLAISLLYCANPTLFFSCRNNTIALPSTLCRSVTSLRITDAKHFSAIRGHCFSTLHFSGAFPNIALPLPRQSLQCHFLAVLFHANTQRLSTMTLLVSSPPRRHYDVHHRNVTALCNAVTRLRHTLPLRHRALPSYATPFHVRTIPSQCFTVFSLTNTELRAAPPYDATTIRFSSALYHGGALRFITLLCHCRALRCQTATSHYSSNLICTIPLRNWFLGSA